MTDRPNRNANRVFFRAPATIRGAQGRYEARIEDISWTGVRLRILRADLEIRSDAGIGAAASCVQYRLGMSFSASLDSDAKGAALVKRLSVVRLALPDADPLYVDLGCLFEDRLGEREAEMLGLAMSQQLPGDSRVRRVGQWDTNQVTSRVNPEVLSRPEPEVGEIEVTHPDASFEPRRSLRAVISCGARGGAQPIVCSTDSFTMNGIVVRARAEMPPFHSRFDRRGVAQAAVTFAEAYGDRVELEIVEGTRRVWQGPTQVCAVEVDPAQSRDVKLTLAFGRPLQKSELKRMKLGAA